MSLLKQDKIDKLAKRINNEMWADAEHLQPREGAIVINKPESLDGGGFAWYLTDTELIKLAQVIAKIYPEDFK